MQTLFADRFLTGKPVDGTGIADVMWLGPDGREMTVPDWEGGLRILGMQLYAADGKRPDRATIWFNGGSETDQAWLPPARPGFAWRLALDSAGEAHWPAFIHGGSFDLPPRAVLAFVEMPASG